MHYAYIITVCVRIAFESLGMDKIDSEIGDVLFERNFVHTLIYMNIPLTIKTASCADRPRNTSFIVYERRTGAGTMEPSLAKTSRVMGLNPVQ